MIREAVEADKLAVLRLLKNSRSGAGFDAQDGPTGFTFPFVAAYAERLFLRHLAHDDATCILFAPEGQPQGVLMASAAEHPFGPVRVATETLWWIEPPYRGKAAVAMLDAYEAWAAVRGCRFAGMAGLGAEPIVARMYGRRGYRPAETHFLKAL